MNKQYIINFFILNLLSYVFANDILGCGGFLKSHVQIDFSKIEIKLLTKQGILKDKTNCSPNGYYFIPLYDKGDYVLQLEPPPGWSFTPTKVNLVIDGKTDICSQGKDVNFSFKGFGITGKVTSYGDVEGPADVTVELKSSSKTRTITTSSGGSFFFTPVYPGKYEVSISHPKWRILQKSLSVTVREGNTDLPENSLTISGYDVTGTVTSEGEAVNGATVILFKADNNKRAAKVEGCSTTPIDHFKSHKNFLCHVTTNENGLFSYPSVSTGDYVLEPYYKGKNIHFQPSLIKFSVHHDSLIIPESFEISGFSVAGIVLASEKGKPLIGATIFVNNKEYMKTNKEGKYYLEKIKAGSYKILVKTTYMEFEEKIFKINPNTLQLPDIYPSAYEVCGIVISESPQIITVNRIGSTQHFSIKSEANTGHFCKYLQPGKYELQVSKSAEGIQFFPVSQTIEITTKPLMHVTFSQLKATIFGQIICLRNRDCISINVFLKPVANDANIENKISFSKLEGNTYKFENVRPGNYEVALSMNNLCWKESKFTILVNSDKHTVPIFTQTGYLLTFVSSHDAQVFFKKDDSKTTSFWITKGRTAYCIDKMEEHIFTFEGCHIFESKTLTYQPDSETNEIQVIAKKHKAICKIKAQSNFGDLFFTVNIEGVKQKAGPLTYKNGYYILELFLAADEDAILIPQSESIYFNPPIISITGGNDCIDFGVKFEAFQGKVFKGKVIPPLAGVLITVSSDDLNSLMVETDEVGNYRLPPLDDTKTYKISASKDSYVLVGPDDAGNFLAHKLADIAVEVLDEANNTPLQGALLSLSGGESYRSNLQTNEEGKIMFQSLSPNEYFLRPMMKEYNFVPNSKIIKVMEGETVKILLRGKRVAYSAFGHITSLNGEHEERIIVTAIGKDNCSHYSEEATTDGKGNFRIRALQPYCSYDVKVKGSLDEKDLIERCTPYSLKINSILSDIKDLKMVIHRPLFRADILVRVYTSNPEHYKTIRIKVARENPSSVIQTTKLDVSSVKLTEDYNSGVLVQLSSIPLDGKLYSVQLESNFINYNKQKSHIHLFTSNSSFHFVDLKFVVKTNATEEHIKQTSLWALGVIFACMVAVYNIGAITQLIKDQLSTLNIEFLSNFKNKYQTHDHVVDTTEIDQIVQNINATKRKVKPRKI